PDAAADARSAPPWRRRASYPLDSQRRVRATSHVLAGRLGVHARSAVPHPQPVLISFRYHIVSLTAVFLSIGLGFVLGSAIQPTDCATRNSISRLTRELNGTRAQIADLRNQVQGSSSVVKNLSSRVIRGALV